jgi:hypothetical protein
MPDPNLSVERLNTITSAIIDAAIRIHRTVERALVIEVALDSLTARARSSRMPL